MLNQRINIYIDEANLYFASRGLGFDIDYYKLYKWLYAKFYFENAFLFTGFFKREVEKYLYLQEIGYQMIFKDKILDDNGKVGANCDSEIVFKITSDYYEKRFGSCVIISGDGDFSCVLDFLLKNKSIYAVMVPRESRCSKLIKRFKSLSVIPLDMHYKKFSRSIEKNT